MFSVSSLARQQKSQPAFRAFAAGTAARPVARPIARQAARLTACLAALLTATLLLAACGEDSGNSGPSEGPLELVIGGIPDQDPAVLEQRFNGMRDYLASSDLVKGREISVRYQPYESYAEVVAAFGRGDIHLSWFGALTGAQARSRVSDAKAIAQREGDDQLRSVFIVSNELPAAQLADLAGYSFTFGDDNSTSGRLMPQFYLEEEGIDPDIDFTNLGFSGSHTRTWQQVQDGSYDAGVLNESVWNRAVEADEIDTNIVRELTLTPKYHNYHWLAHPSIEETLGDGTIDKLQELIVAIDTESEHGAEILSSFSTPGFKETKNSNYSAIMSIAEELDLFG